MVDVTGLVGMTVVLPNGLHLGEVYDIVVDTDHWGCTHLYVRDADPRISEESIPVAIPWRWVKAIGDVLLLRWFPDTPLKFAGE